MSYTDRYTVERNKKISDKLKTKWADPSFRMFMKNKQISKAGSVLVRKKNSDSIKRLWENKEYREKQKNNSSRGFKSEVTKEKISLKLKGRISPRKGYVFNNEERKIASEVSKKVWQREEYRKHFETIFLLSNNPNWRNGISFFPYSFEFNKKLKYEIKLRDNFKCRYCSVSEDEEKNKDLQKRGLTIHHVDHDKKNNSKENLVCACRKCNTKANFVSLELLPIS